MNFNKPRSIIGMSQERRIPRLGKIRLGIKIKNAAGTDYPTNVDYFVVPKEVSAVFGDNPRELRIMFPLNTREEVFPQSWKMYGSNSGLKCQGDGECGTYYDVKEKEYKERDCAANGCPNAKSKNNPAGQCLPTGVLSFVIPEVSIAGIYQIVTHSAWNSFVDINTMLDIVMGMVGRIVQVPLILYREDTTNYPGGEKRVQSTLKLRPDFDPNTPRLEEIKKRNLAILNQLAYSRLLISAPDDLDKSEDDILDEQPIADAVKQITRAPQRPMATPETPEKPKEPEITIEQTAVAPEHAQEVETVPAGPPGPQEPPPASIPAQEDKAAAKEDQKLANKTLSDRRARLFRIQCEFRKKYGQAVGDREFRSAIGNELAANEALMDSIRSEKMFEFLNKKLA